MKITCGVMFIISIGLLAGCQSNKQIENTFDPNYLADSSDLIFTSPNFSAFHAPPLMSGFVYIETYKKDNYCSSGEPNLISKVMVTKKNKTQYSKLPSGEIVARIGYYAIGATGGGLKGLTASSFDVVPNSKYRITVTEARPLVTSYKIRIEQLTENDEAKLIEVVEDNVCVH
jgi:hypothetical protein